MVTWRRAQMVLLSAQGMPVAKIAQVTFTSPDRVRDVLQPKYAGGRPPRFGLPQRQQIKRIALSRPVNNDLPFSTWSLSKLAEFSSPRGWSTTSPTRACGPCCVTRASAFKP
jgi:hypothetical protein